ncbi:MAG: hypothetical protein HY243_12275 [Proteobacteria bacterium]|nr:hypothetical protein [Pseudomonadota bacterium]
MEQVWKYLEILVVAGAFGFVWYALQRMDKMQENIQTAFMEQISRMDAEVKELRTANAELMKYAHENFVAKDDYMFAQGKLGGTLNSIFGKLDELTKQLNQIIGLKRESDG